MTKCLRTLNELAGGARRPRGGTAVAVLVIALTVTGPAFAGEVVEPKTGRPFPTVESGLSLAGVGVRTKLFVKVYAAGFYVDRAGAAETLAEFRGLSHDELVGNDRFYAALVADGFAKSMSMQFVYNAGTKKVREAFREGIEANLPGTSPAAEAFLALFAGELGRKGDRLDVRTEPGGRITVASNGGVIGEVEDAALATALWKIWFGPEPILPKLKSGLVELVPEILE